MTDDPERALAEQASKPKPTLQHLAQALIDVKQTVEDIAEQVNIIGGVTEAQEKKLVGLVKEQTATAILLNKLKGEPGDAVKPSKMDSLAARVEALERATRAEVTDYAPMIDALTTRVNELAAAFNTSSTTASEVVGLSEVQQQVDQLQGAVARLEHDFPADVVGSDVHKALAAYVDEQTNALGARLNDQGTNFSRRLQSLEDSIHSLATGVGSLVQRPAVEAAPAQGVAAKMLALMDEVTAIGKDRRASGGGVSFKFRGVEDAQNAVGQAQRKVRILILPEVVDWQYGQEHVQTEKDGKVKTVTWSTSRLTMRYTFVDPDDGSRMSVTMVGEGKDNSDKSASKAASMACKYALFQALMIPFEDVDESDKQNDARAESHYPQDRMQAHLDREREQARQESPGARVNRGEISPAQAVHEHQQQATQEMTPAEKAAKLIQWAREGQKEPADKALKVVSTAIQRATDNNLGDVEVEGVPLRVHLTTMLKTAGTALAEKATNAQGMTRQEQQTGQGARAAQVPQHPIRNPSPSQMEDALQILEQGMAPDDVLDAAQQTVNNFEAHADGVQ